MALLDLFVFLICTPDRLLSIKYFFLYLVLLCHFYTLLNSDHFILLKVIPYLLPGAVVFCSFSLIRFTFILLLHGMLINSLPKWSFNFISVNKLSEKCLIFIRIMKKIFVFNSVSLLQHSLEKKTFTDSFWQNLGYSFYFEFNTKLILFSFE